jgi:hypothetical protein
MKQPQIDFKFAKAWTVFLEWHNAYIEKAKTSPIWEVQKIKIEKAFKSTASGIVAWDEVWAAFDSWYMRILKKKDVVKWSEMQRQIETLMLEQVKELNKRQFILVFLNDGKPDFSSEKMTYWEALHTKQNLEGDKNGRGGDEALDKITIVNLKLILNENS